MVKFEDAISGVLNESLILPATLKRIFASYSQDGINVSNVAILEARGILKASIQNA